MKNVTEQSIESGLRKSHVCKHCGETVGVDFQVPCQDKNGYTGKFAHYSCEDNARYESSKLSSLMAKVREGKMSVEEAVSQM